MLEEMDLDAVLARRPELVLVDELAHTNAPGSRHPKRYLDVEEILAAGIDVYTTLNIQHVESLNDVVARITRIRVRETVPDGVLDAADDIEVIDISPDDLIQRLKEGQGLRPEDGAAGAGALLRAGEPDRAARTGAAAHRPAGRRAAAVAHAPARHPRPVGGRRAGRGLHQREPRARRPGPPGKAHGRSAARAVDGALRRDRPDAAADGGGARPHRRLPASRRAARRRGDHRAGTGRRRGDPALRPGEQRHPDHHRQVERARAGSSCCTARWSTTWSARRAASASMSAAARGTTPRRRPPRQRSGPRSRRGGPILRPTRSHQPRSPAALGLGLGLEVVSASRTST